MRHLGGLCAAVAAVLAFAAPAHGGTIVTFALDDARQSQYDNARPLFDAHGVKATFFVIDSVLDQPGGMTLAEVKQLQTGGHEIGGHTTLHHDVTIETADENRREICGNRNWLLDHGFQPYDFAFPYARYDATTEQIAHDCGYNSAKGGGGILPSDPSCGDYTPSRCAEQIPPPDPYATRTPPSLDATTTLATMQQAVTNAELHGGGWIEFVIHEVCDNCGPEGLSPSVLASFLDWLGPRAAQGTVVKTVHEVIGGALQPAVAPPPAPAPPAPNMLQNPSVEEPPAVVGFQDILAARCWEKLSNGATPAAWSVTSTAHSGFDAVHVSISSIETWGYHALVPTQDLGACAPTVIPGHTYTFSGWYQSTAPIDMAAYVRTTDNHWIPLDHWSGFAPSATWRQLTWTLTAPANAAAMSVGFWMNQVGAYTLDDFTLVDQTPPTDTTPPETTIDSGPAPSTNQTSASFAFSSSETGSTFACALDGAAFAACTSPQAYTALAQGAHTFQVRATDAAGNVDPTPASRSWTVDTTPPDTTIIGGPAGTVTATSASFSFVSTESPATFACSLDGAPYAACTSPQSYSGLGAGQTHVFQVKASDAAGNTDPTPASRSWTIAAATTAPANDAFGNAQALSGSSGSVTGDTTTATRETGEPTIVGNAGGHSVWFAWTPTVSGTATISTSGSAFDTTLAVYTGSTLTALTKLAENDDVSSTDTTSRVSVSVTAGTTYRIQLDGYNGTSRPPWYGAYKLSWSGPTPPPPAPTAPANDNFANGQALSAASGTATGDTTAASRESGEPTIVGNAGGHSVWFTWTPAASGTATLSTAGSAFDTTLAVYTGSTLTGLTKRAENDDASSTDTTSRISLVVTAGVTYSIQLDGFNGTSRPPWYGAYKLSWTAPAAPPPPAPAPANDNFAAASVLSGRTGTVTGDTTTATREAGEPTIVGNAGGHSVWFSWTASVTGTASFATAGSGFDTTLAVYTGSSLTALTKLGESDDVSSTDTTSKVTFAATAGVTYRIQLDGYFGTSRPPWYGPYKLTWTS